jgi:hypothetical protein
MISTRTLFLVSAAILMFAAMPAMAQSNAAPGNPAITGYPGGKVTEPDGKTVQAPPQPPPGSSGGGKTR